MMATPIIVPVDIVTALLPYLRTKLADGTVTVAASIPNPRPVRLVSLRRSGGTTTTRNIFDRPRIDAQVWAATEFEVMALAARVRGYLLGSPGRVTGVVAASDFLGPTPIPDPDSGAARVLLSIELQTRGTQEA